MISGLTFIHASRATFENAKASSHIREYSVLVEISRNVHHIVSSLHGHIRHRVTTSG